MDINKAFDILDIDGNPTQKEIKTAYRLMLKVWHPDKFQDDKELSKKSEDKTKDIVDAYNFILKNYTPKEHVKINENQSTSTKSHNDFKSHSKYEFHKKYINTKKITITRNGDYFTSHIIARNNLFKNILNATDTSIILNESDNPLICELNKNGMITKMQSPKEKITVEYSKEFLPIKIIDKGENHHNQIDRIDKSYIFNNILDINKPEKYAKCNSLISYFYCSREINNSKADNSYYKLEGYDIYDNFITTWHIIKDEPNPFIKEKMISNNYENLRGLLFYEYDQKGRILRKSNPYQIGIQEYLKIVQGYHDDSTIDMMNMMTIYDEIYEYQENGSFVGKGINYYWQNDKDFLTKFNFENDNLVFASIKNRDDEHIEEATYDNQGRLTHIDNKNLKHPYLLKFKKPKIEGSGAIYMEYQ